MNNLRFSSFFIILFLLSITIVAQPFNTLNNKLNALSFQSNTDSSIQKFKISIIVRQENDLIHVQIKSENENKDNIFAASFIVSTLYNPYSYYSEINYCCFVYDPYLIVDYFPLFDYLKEMLVLDQDGLIKIFPGKAFNYNNITFENINLNEAFIISAKKENGILDSFTISAVKSSIARILLPFPTYFIESAEKMQQIESTTNKEVLLKFEKGGNAIIRNGYE